MNNFKTDLADSAFDFLRVVYPKLKDENLISGELIPIESVTAEGTTKALDMLAGIDIWQIKDDKGIRGIANRIQWGPKPWNTFTIRKKRQSGAKTEYEKRIEAITNRAWLFPYFTCQAYITERRIGYLLSVAIAKTETIFEMINKGICWEQPNSQDGNIFICVDWLNVKIYQPKDIKIWKLNDYTPA